MIDQVVYESVFPEMPANSHQTVDDIRRACGENLGQHVYAMSTTFDTETAIQYLSEVQGNVTRMPLDFLVEEDLEMTWTKDLKSGSVPREVFC